MSATTGIDIDQQRLDDHERRIERLTAVLMQKAVAELSVVSDASAGRSDRDRIHGGSPNHSPRGPRQTQAERHLQAFREATDSDGRLAALEQATKVLLRMRYAPNRSLVQGSDEWRRAVAADDRRAEVVAHVYGCSVRTVYRLRESKSGASPVDSETVPACGNCWATGVPLRTVGMCDACWEFRQDRSDDADAFAVEQAA